LGTCRVSVSAPKILLHAIAPDHEKGRGIAEVDALPRIAQTLVLP